MEFSACPQPSCDLPAEVLDRIVVASTDEPVEHARVLCIAGHRFVLPTELLLAGPTHSTPAPLSGVEGGGVQSRR
jgi:hypothetical protein